MGLATTGDLNTRLVQRRAAAHHGAHRGAHHGAHAVYLGIWPRTRRRHRACAPRARALCMQVLTPARMLLALGLSADVGS